MPSINPFRLPTPLETAAGDSRITPLIEFDAPGGFTDAQYAALGVDLFAIKDADGNALPREVRHGAYSPPLAGACEQPPHGLPAIQRALGNALLA